MGYQFLKNYITYIENNISMINIKKYFLYHYKILSIHCMTSSNSLGPKVSNLSSWAAYEKKERIGDGGFADVYLAI